MFRPSRRTVLTLAAASAGTGLLSPVALAQGERETHGISSFGDLKYGPDFKHFDFVNPQAPKGGSFIHS
ncbi:hypothetical protein, partial [Acinetobacter baumannii]|uniref:hypothetical protein n=1 Tax=Acinetobacter baumannii TaxID=470 RepID=UPI001C0990E0